MKDECKSQDELVGEIVELCERVAELGATLLVRKPTKETTDKSESAGVQSKVYDLPWWAERAMRLKSVDVGDISALSSEDVARLIRRLQVHQVEVKMQNEQLQRIQQELKESRDKYSDLYDFAPVGYFTLSNEWLILEANRTAAAILGTPREDLLSKPFSSFVCKDDYAAYYSHLQHVFQTKTKRTCELRLERHDGTQFHARFDSVAVQDSAGEFNRCRTTMTDITDRKRAEEALRESEEIHRITLTNISDTVLISDDQGEFTYVCPNVHVIFGFSVEEVKALGNVSGLLGSDIFDLPLLESQGEIQNIERRIRDKAGVDHVLLINVKRVRIKGGTVLYSCRDITALKKVEAALEIARQQQVRKLTVRQVRELAAELNKQLGGQATETSIVRGGFREDPFQLLGNKARMAFVQDKDNIKRLTPIARKRLRDQVTALRTRVSEFGYQLETAERHLKDINTSP